MDLIQFQQNLLSIDVWELLLPILEKHASLIVELNKEQLFKGKTKEGDRITPNYFDDQYFPNEKWKSGKQYAIFKKILNDKYGTNPFYSEKGFSTPDFFITGTLVHDALNAYVEGDKFMIAPTGEAKDWDNKYKGIYGLTQESLDILIPAIKEEFIQSIRNAMFKN